MESRKASATPKRALFLIAASVGMWSLLLSPASAHVGGTPTHLWTKHLSPLAKKLFYTKAQANQRYALKSTLSAAGTINAGTNPVAWTKLKGVPAGLADGTDADSGGDITGITTSTGSGLTGGLGSGNPILSLLKTCTRNGVLKWDGSGWVCGVDVGQSGIITRIGAGSGIAVDMDDIFDEATIDVVYAGLGGAFGTESTSSRGDHDHDSRYKAAHRLMVAVSGGDYTNPLQAMESITTASASEPWVIEIAPGVYDLGSTSLKMKPFVSLRGSGSDATFLRASLDSGPWPYTDAALVLTQDSSVSAISIENSYLVGPSRAAAVLAQDIPEFISLDDVEISSNGSAESTAIMSIGASLDVHRARIEATGENFNNGVGTYESPSVLRIWDSRILAGGSSGDDTVIIASHGSDITVNGGSTGIVGAPTAGDVLLFTWVGSNTTKFISTEFSGSPSTFNMNPGSKAYTTGGMLSGVPHASSSSGNAKCLGVMDTTGDALSATCE